LNARAAEFGKWAVGRKPNGVNERVRIWIFPDFVEITSMTLAGKIRQRLMREIALQPRETACLTAASLVRDLRAC